IPLRRPPSDPQPFNAKNLVAGLRFVWQNKVILAAGGLDMFGVLFGAAIALLPIYAEDILGVGSIGYGVMLSAPAAGAVFMSFMLSHRGPIRIFRIRVPFSAGILLDHAGPSLLLAVTGFGVATVIFGFSRWFPLSVAMLFLTGALD